MGVTKGTFAFIVMALSVLAPVANAQYNAAIDVSKCYSTLMQDKTIWQNDENTHYRLLYYMNREDYENLQANGQAQAFIKGIPVGASWEEARAQATKLVQQRDEELLKTQHTYSAVLSLDKQATDFFHTCIKGMVDSNPYGLFYYDTHTQPDTAQLQIEWRWIEGRAIKIKSSNIDGGYIAGTNPKQRTLYPQTGISKLWSPTITQGQNFIVKFDNPNKDINITIVTEPEIRYWPIVIEHLPLRKKCVTNWLTSENDLPLAKSVQFDPALHLTGQGKGGGSGFSYSETVPGVITEINCNKLGADHIELDLVNGSIGTNQATCSGWLNANPRSVVMTYNWKKDETTCDVEEPWPAPTPTPR